MNQTLPGNYPVLANGNEIGELTVQTQGLFTIFEARCSYKTESVIRLAVIDGGIQIPLGVMMPEGKGTLYLKKSFTKHNLQSSGLSTIERCIVTDGKGSLADVQSVTSSNAEEKPQAPALEEARMPAFAEELTASNFGEAADKAPAMSILAMDAIEEPAPFAFQEETGEEIISAFLEEAGADSVMSVLAEEFDEDPIPTVLADEPEELETFFCCETNENPVISDTPCFETTDIHEPNPSEMPFTKEWAERSYTSPVLTEEADSPAHLTGEECPHKEEKAVHGFYPLEDPQNLFADEDLKKAARNITGALAKKEVGVTSLAVPAEAWTPFPLMPILCLGEARELDGKHYIVFKIKNGNITD